MTGDAAGPHIVHVNAVEWQEVKAQQRGAQRVSVWERYLHWSPELLVIHARYDAGMLIERHAHKSNHLVFVLEGSIDVGGAACGPGTSIVLLEGDVFGPIEAGPEGALLLEVMTGDPRAVPADREGFARLLAERGVEPLPNPPVSLPDWLGDRTD